MYFPVLVLSRFIGYRLCRRPLGPEEWILGCLDARMLVFVLAWWQIWHEFELHFGGLWLPVVSLGWFLQACGSMWARLGQSGTYPNEPLATSVQAGELI